MQIIADGVVHPDFTDSKPCTVVQATAIMAQTLHAGLVELPHAAVLAALQTGRVTNPMFLMPMPLGSRQKQIAARGAAKGAAADILTMLGADDYKGGEISSSHDLCRLVHSVILPGLIEKPLALMQWLALTHNVLSIERLYGSFEIARSYMTSVLMHRGAAGSSFGVMDMHLMSQLTAGRVVPVSTDRFEAAHAGTASSAY